MRNKWLLDIFDFITLKDFDKANEMMEKSLIAMDIATKARMSAGVHFKADEAYE